MVTIFSYMLAKMSSVLVDFCWLKCHFYSGFFIRFLVKTSYALAKFSSVSANITFVLVKTGNL